MTKDEKILKALQVWYEVERTRFDEDQREDMAGLIDLVESWPREDAVSPEARRVIE